MRPAAGPVDHSNYYIRGEEHEWKKKIDASVIVEKAPFQIFKSQDIGDYIHTRKRREINTMWTAMEKKKRATGTQVRAETRLQAKYKNTTTSRT